MTPELTNPAVALLAWFAAGLVTGVLAVFPVLHGGKDRRAGDRGRAP